MDLFIVIIILACVLIIPNIKIVPQARAYVIERIGSYYATWSNGLHFQIPFLDKISNKVNLQ